MKNFSQQWMNFKYSWSSFLQNAQNHYCDNILITFAEYEQLLPKSHSLIM